MKQLPLTMPKVNHDISIRFQSTPQLWLATREGWEPGSLYGLGKTPTLALAELLERELESEESNGRQA